MLKIELATVAVCLMALVGPAEAQASGRRLPGYECMMLNITEQQAMDPNFHVEVKAQPLAASSTIGWQPGVVIVKEPAVPNRGYLQVLRANGQKGWIKASLVKPYRAEADPTARCAPEILPNGLIGSGPG